MSVDWNKRFLVLSELVASWSKDTSRGVGAVIVDEDERVLSVGYNGFPRGADDTKEERYERPAKYLYTEHAERNCIYSAARNGVSLKDAIIFTSLYPCADCARGIIQSGIKTVVTYPIEENHDKWGESFKVSAELFEECGVKVKFITK
jgi:dCMP deaminase